MKNLFTICLCLLLSPALIYAQGSWLTASSDGFTPRWAASAAEDGGKIYVMGGLNNSLGGVINTLEVFSPFSGSWITPVTTGQVTKRRSASAVALDGKIYVIGGYDTVSLNTLEVFSPSTNAWSTPVTTGTFTARASHTSAELNGKIYVVGGYYGAGIPISKLEVFDPSINTWLAPTASGTFTPRHGLTSCVLSGKMYTFGGANENGVLNSLEIFDPLTNAWSTPTTTGTFTARRGASCSVLDGKIYVIGGNAALPNTVGNYLSIVEIFDPSTNTWTSLQTNGSFTARYGHTSSTVSGKIYAFGGQNKSAIYTNISEVFTPATSSIVSNPDSHGFQISPNPTNGIFAVHNALENLLRVSVLNLLGESVLEIVNPHSTEFSIDLSAQPIGVYLVRFVSVGNTTIKLIIKN